MKASYLTQFGAMAIPLGVSLIAIFPTLRTLSIWIIVAGLISLMLAWGYTIRDEKRLEEKEKVTNQQRQNDEKRRRREHRENLTMLVELADKRGLSTARLLRLLERLREEEEDDNGV